MAHLRKRWRWSDRATVVVMLTPFLLGLLSLVLLPSLLALTLAFTNFDALTLPAWVGLRNFIRLLDDRLFGIALLNTLLYVAMAVPLRIGCALLLALLFSQPRYGHWVARSTVYLPTVIPDIAYALVWLVALNPRYGPINLLLGSVGLPTPGWPSEPWPAHWALVLIAVWQLGESFVILLAAVAGIPLSLREASALDGAGPFAYFRYILLPLLLPSLLFLSARDLIVCLQTNFVPALVITKGGPGYATLFIPLYAYQLAFEDLRLGYAAAVVWTLYGITLFAVGLQWWWGRRWRYEGSWL